MPDEQPGAEQQQEQAPAWLQQLGNELAHQRQMIGQLAQEVQRGRQPAPPQRPAQAPPPTSEVRERILHSIVNEPERFTAETVGFAVNTARQEFQQALAAEREAMQRDQQTREFWREFYAANPDVAPFSAEIFTMFQRVDPTIADWSVRANMARDEVRNRIAQVTQMQQEQQKREEQQKRLMAGVPGGAAPQMASLDPVQQAQDEAERTAEAIRERRALREMKAGHNLRDDPAYHEERRQEKLRREGARRVA